MASKANAQAAGGQAPVLKASLQIPGRSGRSPARRRGTGRDRNRLGDGC